jgi:cyclophilin family peptidyl-prolyl cis-trans isomerase
MTRYLVAVVALVLGAAGVVAGCSTGGGGSNVAPPSLAPTSAPTASGGPASGAPSTGPAGSGTASGTCPTAQPPALGAGQKRDVTIETAKGKIQITIVADLSPIAAGNFVALAGCGFYNGVVFHRVVPNFVIQGGDPTGTGSGGPGYTIKDEPVTAIYGRGTVAMARTSAPDSVGSQFFIVLSDDAQSALASYNTYQIIGTVTSGMEAADAIAAAADAELPTHPIAMDKVTVSTP